MARPRLDSAHYVQGTLAKDLAVLSKAITLVESNLPEDQPLATEIVEACLPHSGHSLRVGITGSPGVGKSTFIEAFGLYLCDVLELRVAVLAIDPSSARSQGSILGDKTRMEQLSRHPNAYIRPSPSGGTLGGVHRATRETIILVEAAGYDVVLIETVGVGQSETAVRSMVDFFLLLIQAGAGDELQGIKRGIVEMADTLLVTKADGPLLHAAELARAQYAQALHYFPANDSDMHPQTLTCSALEGKGLAEVWQLLQHFRETTQASGYWARNRQQQQQQWLLAALEQAVLAQFFARPGLNQALQLSLAQVAAGKLTPTRAVNALLEAAGSKSF